MTHPHIEINGLRAKFGKFELGPLDLRLEKGEYLVLLGPTGCGKTSLMKCIAGYERRVRGSIVVGGNDITNLYPAKRRVAYVTQSPNLFPHLTVAQNVAFGLRYLNISSAEQKERMVRYMALFELEHIKDNPGYAISGGERKRCALARSLILDPDLLLLDEPIGMLDHNGRRKMLDILRMIHGELGTTAIHVTHDRHEAWGISDRCAVMNAGQILQTGRVDELFRKPDNLFTAEFLGCANIFEAEISGGRANLGWAEIVPGGEFENGAYYAVMRPEMLELTRAGEGRVPVRVDSVADFGEYFEVKIKTAGGETLTVHSAKKSAAGLIAGAEAGLDWRDSETHFFAKR